MSWVFVQEEEQNTSLRQPLAEGSIGISRWNIGKRFRGDDIGNWPDRDRAA